MKLKISTTKSTVEYEAKQEHHMEGPSIWAVAEKLEGFAGKTVTAVSGNAKIEKDGLVGATIEVIYPRGKNLFIQFPHTALRIHFLMYGSYRINETREGMEPRLALAFDDEQLNFYNCSVRIVSLDQIDVEFDEERDIVSCNWNAMKVIERAAELKDAYICDVLLNQEVFAGVGNIIKNEALFMAKLHPLSVVGCIPHESLVDVTFKVRAFSQLFHTVRRNEEHLQPFLTIYRKKSCPLCHEKVVLERTGESARISFFCPSCQVLYTD
ncbi:MAG: DNA-formamidopyrimidine glycosylase family protein [Candidatus Methanospirareceae archaeon]